MFTIETVSGPPYEMGLQHGRIYRHLVEASVHNIMYHTFQATDDEMKSAVAKWRRADETHAPWVLDELRGIAEGSGVAPEWIQYLHWRIWNQMKPHLPPVACTGIGMLTTDSGLVVGGTLDDPVYPYVLIRRLPAQGIPHVMICWAGSAWGHNGMNAAGLCVAQSSAGGFEPELTLPPGIYASPGTAGRLMLQTCETVTEAVELLKRIRPTSNYVLGDAGGNVRVFQGTGPYQALAGPQAGMVFATNHPYLPELVAQAAKLNCHPHVQEDSGVRLATLEKARQSRPCTLAAMKGLLQSHEGWPHSICRGGTAMASFAAPQTIPGIFHVARRPPCRNLFVAYPVVESEK